MNEILTEIDIDASASRVWGCLVDFPRFKDWNPLIREVRGDMQPGRRIRVSVRLPGGVSLTFRPRLLAVRPDRELRWIDRTPIPGLLEGEHWFILEPSEDGRVRFLHGERFRGLASVLFGGLIDRQLRPGYEAMNRTLKEVAESDGSMAR